MSEFPKDIDRLNKKAFGFKEQPMTNDDKDLKPISENKMNELVYDLATNIGLVIHGCVRFEHIEDRPCSGCLKKAQKLFDLGFHRATPQQPSEPLKELDEKEVKKAVGEALEIGRFTGGAWMGTDEKIAKHICSKFGQPSEKKALSIDFIYEVIEREYLKGIIHPENVHIPNSFKSSAKIIFDALPAQREVRYPEYLKCEAYCYTSAGCQCGAGRANKIIDEFKKLNS